MAAHSNQTASPFEFRDLRRKFGKFIFVFAEPTGAALGFFVDYSVRSEAIELGIIVNLTKFVPVIFAERPAVIHDERRSFRNSRLHEHLEDIFVERRDRQRVLVAMEAVEDMRQIQLQIQRAFSGGHHFKFLRRLHHVLPLFAVADKVAFDVVGTVVFAIFRQHAFDFFRGLKIIVGENSRTRRESALADDVAGVHKILVGEHIVRAGLHIQTRGDAVGEVREERPVLRIEDAASNFKPVRVRVDKSRCDCFSANVEYFRPAWSASFRTDSRDAVVFDDNIGVFQHFIALHGDDGRSTQHDSSLGGFARQFQVNRNFLNVFFLFLEFLRFFLFFLFVFLGVGGIPFIFIGVFGVAVFLFAFLLLVLRRLKGNRTQWLAEIACANGPGDCFSIVGPAKIIRANIGNLFERDGRSTDADRRSFTTNRRHGQEIKLILDVCENPLAVRTWHQIVGGNRLFEEIKSLSLHLQMCAAVGPVVAQGNKSARRININAIFFVREVRAARTARRKNQICFAAIRGYPDEIGIPRLAAIECAVLTVISIATEKNNFCSIGRKSRIAINRQRLRKLHRCSASG